MAQVKNEQTETVAHPAEAESMNGESSVEVSFGKFKDAEALLNAYNSLQSEFTKRCQRVKELEAKISAVDKETPPTQTEEDKHHTEDNDIIKEFLKGVMAKKQTAIVMDGTGVSVTTPVSRPKNIAQAGMLAQEIFNK